jgi:hypothetical protein
MSKTRNTVLIEDLTFLDSLRARDVFLNGTTRFTDSPRNLTAQQSGAITFLNRIADAIEAQPEPQRSGLQRQLNTVYAVANDVYMSQTDPDDVLKFAKGDPKTAAIPPGFLRPRASTPAPARRGQRVDDRAMRLEICKEYMATLDYLGLMDCRGAETPEIREHAKLLLAQLDREADEYHAKHPAREPQPTPKPQPTAAQVKAGELWDRQPGLQKRYSRQDFIDGYNG